MGVPLQLILGILLVLTPCSLTNSANLRQIREAPPPSPAPIQNVTEINNRDLNKIIKDNPKTENVDSKAKFVNTLHNYDVLPLKLSKHTEEIAKDARINGNKSEEETSGNKEDLKKNPTKLANEKHREENSRAIGIDASNFWSPDFHSKNVFTLPTAPDIEKFQEPPDFSFEVTKHPSFETHIELTTPSTKIFDEKLKETVESVEQNIENNDNDRVGHHEHQESDTPGGQNRDVDLNIEDLLKKPDTEALEFVKTKNIVNNETVDKNSIQKNVNVEQIKKLNYESIFNDTKMYGETTTKGDTSEFNSTERPATTPSTIITSSTTRKSSLLKESLTEINNAPILSNNIETETKKPFKDSVVPVTSITTKKGKGELTDNTITTAAPSPEEGTAESQSTSSTATSTTTTRISIPILKINISDQENVIPLHFDSESTPIQESLSERPSPTNKNSTTTEENSDKKLHSIETRIAIDKSTESLITTTEINTTTDITATTVIFDSAKELSIDTTTVSFEEGTTTFIVENTTELSDATTEVPYSTEEGITTVVEILTTESGHRTSKSLDNSITTDHMEKVSERSVENTTKEVIASTESTLRNELDSTTLNDDEERVSTNKVIESKDVDETTIVEVAITSTLSSTETSTLESEIPKIPVNVTTQKVTAAFETTTEIKPIVNITEKVPETTLESMHVNITTQKTTKPLEATTKAEVTLNTTLKDSEEPNTTVGIITTAKQEKSHPTTTEYAFVHIENTGNNRTTLLPEILNPNLNYSTTAAVDNEINKIRKVTLDGHGIRADVSSSPAAITTSTSITNTSSTTTTTTSTTTTTTTTTTQEPTVTDDGTETTENNFSADSGGDKGKIAAIAISSVGAVCLVLLAGLLYVMKKRQKRLKYGPRCRPVSLDDYNIDNLSVYNSVRRKGGARHSKRSFGNPAFDDPVAPSHPLNFPALAKFSTNLEDIKAEFDDIPQISARTSELPDGCETKNRYANVIPLPETRVFLKFIDGYPNSDYINANYVTGPKNIKGYYIASQGPMQNTVDDFWRMIWEQQAKVVLMLTHLVENGLEKCVDYLPESEVIDCSRLFGDFQIILKKQEVKDKYIISTLQLKNMVSNSWREVTHFWYLGWPEKGVPAEGNSLIAFLIEARSYMKTATIDKREGVNGIQNGGGQNEHNPVVIHCSPGTGRTGVAIACDIAIREFETTRLVDIPKAVYRIRRDRAGAVQTKEQYIFIYKVVSLYATKLTGEALENF